ncbi:MAG: SapC family protein [Betaproteobacteria bacterium]|nr:SapC family protein [Betaproteobacteria bacterium]
MQISPPFGYREIVPFYKQSRVRLPAAGELPEFARTSSALPVSFTEFVIACRDYPLVFMSTDNGKTFGAIAVVGMAANENLFVKNGAWEVNTYVPAYVRRYPFCMARITLGTVEQSDRVVCVESSFIAEDGEAMFDDAGEPLERWTQINKLLNEFEADLERSREMCSILADYVLLEPFTIQATLKDSTPLNLGGMYRVAEKKLEYLNAAQHKNLFKKGIVGRIYAHLLSLDNFGRVLARKGASSQAAQAADQPKA